MRTISGACTEEQWEESGMARLLWSLGAGEKDETCAGE